MPAANRAVRQANDDAVGVIVVLGIAAVLVGVIVGAVGVGGVLLPPALILLGGLAPADATAISLISFTLAGAVSAGMFLRGGEFPTAVVGRLAVGLVPAAFVGGWLSDRIPAAAVLAALCAVCLFSALWTTIRPTPQSHRDSLAAGSAVPIGAGVGFGSAVTGTSGPVLLTPALIAYGFPASRAIVAGQVVQVLVTPAGAAGHLVHGAPNLPLTIVLGTATAVGVAAGIVGTRRLRPPEVLLRRLVTVLLVGTGVLVAVRLAAL